MFSAFPWFAFSRTAGETPGFAKRAPSPAAGLLSSRRSAHASLVSLVFSGGPAVLASLSLATAARALPTGGQVAAGVANVTQTAQTLTITQTTQNAAINWQGFSIAPSESVRFDQPNSASITLNRVVGQDASQILGGLSANGQVFVLNPNGVLFGKDARVDVGGLVASTLGMTDADFMAGRNALTKSAIAGPVINEGSIVAHAGGYVALVGPRVGNHGTIDAPGGTVALAAGDKVTLTLDRDSLLGLTVDLGGLDTLVENRAVIRSAGGQVILSAGARDQLLRAAVNNSGIIEAASLTNANGVIRMAGASVANSGALAADTVTLTAVNDLTLANTSLVRAADITLTGGMITGLVKVAGTLDASTEVEGRSGGHVAITGRDVLLLPTALVDASGAAGGGVIQVGGGWQGTGDLAHATNVTVQTGAILTANAGAVGNGGTIAIWSDGATQVLGTLHARGGARSGDGGLIETSGHVLDVTDITVDAAASRGVGGTWLLDPYDLTVTGGANTATQSPTGTWTSGSGASNVLNTDINSALNAGTSVVLQTAAGGGGLGDITVSAPIAKTSGAAASLTLKAHGSITVSSAISSTAGAMAVTLNSNIGGTGGFASVTAPLTTLGGDIVIGGGADPLSGNAVGVAGSGVTLTTSLNAGGGNITVHGLGSNVSSGYGINSLATIVTSGTGNITLVGTGGAGATSIGVSSNAAISTGSGNIAITGSSGLGATGSQGYGFQDLAGAISTGGSGTITLSGTARGNGTGSNTSGVLIAGGATVTAANGLVSVTGTNLSTGTGGTNHGVSVTGAGSTIRSTGTGGVTVLGFGGGTGAGSGNRGVTWGFANAIQATGGGAIAITGVGGGAGGAGATNYGVYVGGALAGSGGAISITGTGGSSSGNSNFGVNQSDTITNTLTGNIALNGTGGGSGNSEVGYSTIAKITAGTGNITITGTASATAIFLGNHGINIGGGITSTTGTGSITLNGTATGLTNGVQSHGVVVQGSAIVSAADGLISVTGHNNSTGSGIGNNGVYIKGAGSTISSTGTGGMTILGVGGGSGTSGNNFGVYWDSANGIQSPGAGAILITGFGGDAGGSGLTNYGVNASGALTAIGGTLTIAGVGGAEGGVGSGNFGVNIAAALTGSGSSISISGTGGNSTGSSNYGISQAAAIANTGAGSITLNGTGGGSGSLELGVTSISNITAGTGNIAITGLASPTAGGSTDSGVNLVSGRTSTAGAGTITIAGTARGSGTGAGAYGVVLSSGAGVSAVNGLISITGTNLSSGRGSGNYGTAITGTNSTVKSTGAGGVTIVGTGGGSGSGGGGHGVHWDAVGAIQSTGLGAISITGVGGNMGGTGGGNSGVNGVTGITGGGGAINISGTASTSTGGSNYGINISTVAAGAGVITLTSTSANNLVSALTGTGLKLLGAGGVFSLTSSGNAVTTLAGSTGAVTYSQIGALTIDTVDATVGLVTTGKPWVTTGSALTIAAGARVSGLAPVLAATGAFINNAGSGAVVATSGRWLVYSADAGGDIFGSLNSGHGAVWNVAPNGAVTATGNRYVFVNQPTATIATVNTSKVYGIGATAAVAASYTVMGLQSVAGAFTDTAAEAFFGAPLVTSAGSASPATVAGSPYAITASAGTLTAISGYGIAYASSGVLTVDAAPLSVTADAQTRVYGAANPALTYVATGLVNGDTLSGLLATPATATSNVGGYAITQGTLAASSNYALSYTPGTLTVGAAPLSVTADAQTRVYGAANPALTYVATGLVNGDILSGLLATPATATSNVGGYAITQGTLAASSNYALSYTPGTLTVGAAPLSVTADAQTRVYGAANPALTYVATGLVNGDTLSGLLATPATATSNVGGYAITQGTLAATSNYVLSFTGANLTVSPALLTVTANAQRRFVGVANPALTYLSSGLVNGDTLSGDLTTTATLVSGEGSYPILQGTLAATPNYALTYVGATLTVAGTTPPAAHVPTSPLADDYAKARQDLEAAYRDVASDPYSRLVLGAANQIRGMIVNQALPPDLRLPRSCGASGGGQSFAGRAAPDSSLTAPVPAYRRYEMCIRFDRSDVQRTAQTLSR